MKGRIFIVVMVLVCIVLAAAAMYFLTPAVLENTTTLGLKVRSQTWRGTVTVKGDVNYAPWATMTVAPGTKILFDKNPDIAGTAWAKNADAYIIDNNDPTGRVGYGKSHFHIYGTILAVGTREQPILFTSVQAKPEYADWDQLILNKGSRLEYVEVSYAHNGVNISGTDVTVRKSKIHDSLWSCVDVFAADASIELNEVYHCWHQAIGTKLPGPISITSNIVHDANLGINCENGSNPSISGNSFSAAPWSPTCGDDQGNAIADRPTDVLGGTYNGVLVYPAPR